jgi:CspA family cold shock protein
LLGFPSDLQTLLGLYRTVRRGNPARLHGCELLKALKMINGTVKFYNSTKGFGFISPDSGGKDAFVHVSALERAGISSLADGQKVIYDLEKGRDGRESAINVKLA